MKTLSITEPYATLIHDGVKVIETRSWKTNYRGPLLIHASNTKIPKEYKANADLMKLVGDRELHFGQIVAKCVLVDCIKMNDYIIKAIKEKYPDEYICGFYEPGRYAWILADLKPVESNKVKGKLRLWDYDEKEGE